jgi:hypothetical protein
VMKSFGAKQRYANFLRKKKKSGHVNAEAYERPAAP